MKTLVDIDEKLLEKAMQLSEISTKKDMVHKALEEFIKLKSRERLKAMAGSGVISSSLRELKASRLKREKKQTRLKKASR